MMRRKKRRTTSKMGYLVLKVSVFLLTSPNKTQNPTT